jgi:hypothetical protein
MNTSILALSSSSTNQTEQVSLISMDDNTIFTIDLSDITETVLPTYVKIDWGDGVVEDFNENNIYDKSRENINIFKFSPLLTNLYKHEYTPSSTSLYKNLSAQVLINYSNGDMSWFVIPIQIRTYDYFEAVGDVKLVNTNILPISDNTKEHQLITTNGKFMIELYG